jgi:hypothetical protein
MARAEKPLQFVEHPCKGVFWKCTDGKFDGYGNTQHEAKAAWEEAKLLKISQPLPRFGADGKRRHW